MEHLTAMKIIYNDIIPFEGYKCINICGILFVRNDVGEIDKVDLNHEAIHSKQWLELLIVGFILWYIIEWLVRVLFSKDRFSHQAYRNISLEKEAYLNEQDLDYLNKRDLFNFINYI